MRKIVVSSLAALAVMAAASGAFAAPVTWYLQNVTFSDGGAASGSFVFDIDTNTYSSVNISTTTGSVRAGKTYSSTVASPLSSSWGLRVKDGVSGVNIPFSAVLTNAGGVTSIAVGVEGDCGTVCDGGFWSHRMITGGTVSSVAPVAAPVPTLSEWAMILLGVMLAGGAALTIQRRRTA